MEEQKNYSQHQMNTDLKSVTVNIELESETRRELYRLTARLLQFSFEGESQRRLTNSLGYALAETMREGVKALTALTTQMQRAFDEELPIGTFDPDFNAALDRVYGPDRGEPETEVPNWLETEQEKWRRFELIVTDKAQMDELNEALRSGNFTRRELALIVTSLRLRPEFSLDDFTLKSDRAECFAQDDP